MSILLETRGLTIKKGNRTLCHQLDLTVNQGERWGILGQNGAGKTSLLYTLAGLELPQRGERLIMQDHIETLSRRVIAQRLGLMLQDTPDPFPATVLQTALMGRHPYLSRWQWESQKDHDLTRSVLEQVGLNQFDDRQVTSLSGGERRRLALATLLVQSPPLMLLDEPTNHLDLHYQHAMLKLIQQQSNQAHAAIMVLHDINHVAQYCTHVLLLFAEGASLTGSCQSVLTTEHLSKVFNTQIKQHDINGQNYFYAA